MPRDTYLLNLDISNIHASLRLDSSNVSDGTPRHGIGIASSDFQQPYQLGVSVFSIFNRKGSNKKVYLHDLDLSDLSNIDTGGSGLSVASAFQMITAASGGTLIPAVPLDSNAASISAVEVRQYPSSTTYGSTIRKTCFSVGVQLPVSRLTAGNDNRSRNISGSDLFWCGNSATQCITLREGQGIALNPYNTSAINTNQKTHQALITLIVGTETYTYTFPFQIYTLMNSPAFSIFNPSGSGLVVKIARISAIEMNTATSIAVIQKLQTITDAIGGTPVTCYGMDSSNESLNSFIEVRTGALALMAQKDASFYKHLRISPDTGESIFTKKVETTMGYLVLGAGGISPIGREIGSDNSIYRHSWSQFRITDNNLQPIILREGEGIAVMRLTGSTTSQYSSGNMARTELLARISVEDTRYWSVTGTFKSSAAVNLPDGTPVYAFKVSDESLVGTGTISSGSATVLVNTSSDVYLVVDPAASGLNGETLCTTPITPS